MFYLLNYLVCIYVKIYTLILCNILREGNKLNLSYPTVIHGPTHQMNFKQILLWTGWLMDRYFAIELCIWSLSLIYNWHFFVGLVWKCLIEETRENEPGKEKESDIWVGFYLCSANIRTILRPILVCNIDFVVKISNKSSWK